MKNQYFGDKRDLIKYGLLEALTGGIPGIVQLTCIWLLTPPSNNTHGNRHFKASREATALELFLKECVTSGRRDVRELARYMSARSEQYVSIGDERSHYFTGSSREAYFDAIPDAALRRAVVFFDPDNGLEPRGAFTDAHLKY